MSFPCGTISASRKLPFPGDFYGEGEESPFITLRSAGLGGGTGFSGQGNPGPTPWGLGAGAAGRGAGRGPPGVEAGAALTLQKV